MESPWPVSGQGLANYITTFVNYIPTGDEP